MIKREELTNENSCMSRAKDDEMTFVLLGRDVAAPAAIRAWTRERIRLGKNKYDDKQITQALRDALTIELALNPVDTREFVHPFDFHELLTAEGWTDIVRLNTMVDVQANSNPPYTSQAPVYRIGNKEYVLTTTVAPKTKGGMAMAAMLETR